MSHKAVMKELNRFCIPRRKGTIKVHGNRQRELEKERHLMATHRRGWVRGKDSVAFREGNGQEGAGECNQLYTFMFWV